ncbi:MAG: hypothetical protein PHW73_05555 [Atribacterota bacterium]|nr:hypothetical protein [Atribacterota bacterium]
MLFASMIHGLCVFGKDDPKRKKIPEFQKAGLDICKNFGHDASLFEVGCYLYFSIELWLFHNIPDLRYSILKYFGKEFSKLFAIALDMDIDNVIDLFNERGSMYADIVRKGEDWIEESYLILSSLVLKTKDNNLPKSYRSCKLEEIPLELGTIRNYLIRIELISWEEAVIPILINNLKKYCELLEEQI